jgi:mono/diheme cytochrome c family protein
MGSRRRPPQSWIFALLAAALLGPSARAEDPARIEFNRDVRPILAGACFRCHGPDKAKRKAQLRLDTEDGARADLDGRHAIVPGNLGASALWERISSDDPDERMPPKDSGLSLTPAQREALRKWIEQGAAWQPHWSLIAPKRPALPSVARRDWPRNAVDRFILARLESERLAPSPEAGKSTLIRRVTLDLTGLPPTPAEVDAFLGDPSPDAYPRVVERLLHSPRFGERMAKRWLDAARYADTNGYQSDGERTMWRWRDWVIDACNQNKPFDVFTVEQIAGDLLPNATREQVIATGFNRNHRGNAEGGIIPEEYAVEYVADRVETTAFAWLGLTLGCARCHDHKFDPVSQADFYKFFAFFNNVPERGRAVKYGNSPPVIASPTRAQEAALADIDAKLAAAERRFAMLEPVLSASLAEWEQSTAAGPPSDWSDPSGRVVHLGFDGLDSEGFRGGAPVFDAGRVGRSAVLDGRRWVELPDAADFGFLDAFTLAAWIRPVDDRAVAGTVISRLKDDDQGEGYSVTIEKGKVRVNFVKRWLDDALRVEADAALSPGRWSHLTVTYDGSRVAEGVRVYLDGAPRPVRAVLDELNQSFKTTGPLRIGAGVGSDTRFRGRLDDVQVFRAVLSDAEVAMLATPEGPAAIAAIPPGERTPAQRAKLRACFLDRFATDAVRQVHRERLALRSEMERLVASFPTTMVMKESPALRETFVLIRGAYDRRGPRVSAGVPASLPPLPKDAPANRLGLGRWLVDPANPLTARVAVNGYWSMLFGTGLVKTAEDLGVQGEWPSHPELLDWLATEFTSSGWDVKAILRAIVTSATYRQESKASPALHERDPENRLLARGPRFRLPAEMIRDQALMVGGLLTERLGGASVRPYQPDGLWGDLAESKDYGQSHGPDLYRRTLYTFWKRTVAPPFLSTFDAATRDRCVVRESRTNTPLQALNLMNDVAFIEAARGLAQRIMTDGGASPDARLSLAFRAATARRPTANELDVLLHDFHDHLAHFHADPAAARDLVRQGESRRDPALNDCELAAYTAVASLILNLDETLTKE